MPPLRKAVAGIVITPQLRPACFSTQFFRIGATKPPRGTNRDNARRGGVFRGGSVLRAECPGPFWTRSSQRGLAVPSGSWVFIANTAGMLAPALTGFLVQRTGAFQRRVALGGAADVAFVAESAAPATFLQLSATESDVPIS